MCQVHTAVSAIIRSWWLEGAAADQLIEEARREIRQHQQKIAQSRESHTRTTRQRLTELGIDLTNLKIVHWNNDTEP